MNNCAVPDCNQRGDSISGYCQSHDPNLDLKKPRVGLCATVGCDTKLAKRPNMGRTLFCVQCRQQREHIRRARNNKSRADVSSTRKRKGGAALDVIASHMNKRIRRQDSTHLSELQHSTPEHFARLVNGILDGRITYSVGFKGSQ